VSDNVLKLLYRVGLLQNVTVSRFTTLIIVCSTVPMWSSIHLNHVWTWHLPAWDQNLMRSVIFHETQTDKFLKLEIRRCVFDIKSSWIISYEYLCSDQRWIFMLSGGMTVEGSIWSGNFFINCVRNCHLGACVHNCHPWHRPWAW